MKYMISSGLSGVIKPTSIDSKSEGSEEKDDNGSIHDSENYQIKLEDNKVLASMGGSRSRVDINEEGS